MLRPRIERDSGLLLPGGPAREGLQICGGYDDGGALLDSQRGIRERGSWLRVAEVLHDVVKRLLAVALACLSSGLRLQKGHQDKQAHDQAQHIVVLKT